MKKKIIRFTLLIITIVLLITIYCNLRIYLFAKNKTFDTTESVPYNKVGLLLGTSKFLKNGNQNYYYKYRIDAAVALLKAGKIKYLVISGDNGRKEYNEPEMMRQDLINAGIDSTKLFLDYAGFRTFDSMIRLKELFRQNEVTIISQQFHNERAIYIAKREGIKAIGYNAKDVKQYGGFKTKLREKLARVKVFWDYIFRTKPKYLGEKIVIPE